MNSRRSFRRIPQRRGLREAIDKPNIPRDKVKNYNYSEELTDSMADYETYLSDDNEIVDVHDGIISYDEDAREYEVSGMLFGEGVGRTVNQAFKAFIEDVKKEIKKDGYYRDFAIDDSEIDYDILKDEDGEFKLLLFVADSEGELADLGYFDEEEDSEYEETNLYYTKFIKFFDTKVEGQKATVIKGPWKGVQGIVTFVDLLPDYYGIRDLEKDLKRSINTFTEKEIFDMCRCIIEDGKRTYSVYGHDIKLDREREIFK